MYIQIGKQGYELVQDNRNGWNPEAFKQRYSEVLDRYDYIVGDWGYNQLRLKGFYRDNHPKVTRDTAISGMVDYINEYCNFGCAYFVLQKLKELPKDKEAWVSVKPDKDGAAVDAEAGNSEDSEPAKEQPLREHLSSREHHAKMKLAKEASKAAAREAREGKETKERETKEKEVREKEDRPGKERSSAPRGAFSKENPHKS